MKIPSDPTERLAFYSELISKMFESADERRSYYSTLRTYVKNGGMQQAAPIFNNMGAHMDLLACMLYAQDTTRFSMEPDATSDATVLPKLSISGRRVQQEWQDSNCDQTFAAAIRESFSSGTAIVMLMWGSDGKEGCVQPYLIDAEKFGVLRETVGSLSRQHAVAYKYEITKSSLDALLRDHPKRASIMEQISASKGDEDSDNSDSGQQKLFISGTQPNLVGSAPFGAVITPTGEPVARTADDLVQMCALYVYDDDAQDFRYITLADPWIVIYERHLGDKINGKSVFVKGELPFIKVCPNPNEHYFWGTPEAGKLQQLQDWLNQRISETRSMMNRQARPPGIARGLGDQAEIADMMSRPGGVLTSDDLFGEIEYKEITPDIPEDLFRDLLNIMDMFNQISGLPKLAQGQGEQGVRSDAQVRSLMQAGTTRIKNRALVIERSLSDAATLIWKMLRTFCSDRLIDEDGQLFLMQQLPDTLSVKVDAHSSSPAFVEEDKDRALVEFKAGLIDAAGYFDRTNPPMREMLKHRAKQMQEQAAKAAAAQQQNEKVIELAKLRKKA
jgi:hypothetical protein